MVNNKNRDNKHMLLSLVNSWDRDQKHQPGWFSGKSGVEKKQLETCNLILKEAKGPKYKSLLSMTAT